MISRIAPTATVTIYIAGDHAVAQQVCREVCYRVGMCVTVEALAFIYTGGEEAGVRVGLINYPRFPSTTEQLLERAHLLAEELRTRLCQHSYTIVGPAETVWVTQRTDALSADTRAT